MIAHIFLFGIGLLLFATAGWSRFRPGSRWSDDLWCRLVLMACGVVFMIGAWR